MRSRVRALVIILLPVLVFVGPGLLMMHLTGRDQFAQTDDPASVPLNFRALGYDAGSASAYWAWLGPEGRAAERRFLIADLAFPVLYSASMVLSLLIAWKGLRRRVNPRLLALPLATVLADWTENTVHLLQLPVFEAGSAVDAAMIRAGSFATSAKIILFWLSYLAIVFLAYSLFRQRDAWNAD
jgi:hypothetical protein